MSPSDWDPYEGYALDYVDPLSRSCTLPSIACRAQRLPTGSKTAAQRHTTNRIVTVVSGHGRTIAGETVLAWKKGDTFVIPGWTWFEHRAESDADAFLFNMTDEPLLSALALMKSEYQDRKTA
jgi:gentisate 1,2-dioxygenase